MELELTDECNEYKIGIAVAALSLLVMAPIGFIRFEELFSKQDHERIRKRMLASCAKFVLSTFDMEELERIYNEREIVVEYLALSSKLHSNCDPLLAIIEGKVEVYQKFSALREHDICDVIRKYADHPETIDFKALPRTFPLHCVELEAISESDIYAAVKEMRNHVPLREDRKMQLNLELAHGKCFHVLDNLVLEAMIGMEIPKLDFNGMPADERKEAESMCSMYGAFIISGLMELGTKKGLAMRYFQEAVSFPISRGGFGPCTSEVVEIIKIADHERRMKRERFISVQHILFGLSLSRVRDFVKGIVNRRNAALQLSLLSIYKLSRDAATLLGDEEVGLEHLVLAIFYVKQENDPIGRLEVKKSSLLPVLDRKSLDMELLESLRNSDASCAVESYQEDEPFDFLPEDCRDGASRHGARVTCDGLVFMEKLHEAVNSGTKMLISLRTEN